MSLRLALKQSALEAATEPPNSSRGPKFNTSTMAQDGQPQSTTSPTANQPSLTPRMNRPKITKSIRNTDPTQIDNHGFVEVSNVLSQQLLQDIKSHAQTKIESQKHIEISNALQVDVSKELFNEMKFLVDGNEIISNTMKFVYGQESEFQPSNYNGFVVETPKVLVALPGSDPQLPHADDHCTSCIICLLHLGDGQEPTRIAKYDGMNKDYPTGITVSCDSELLLSSLCY